ncbi:MAG: hypothetical protein V3S48_07785 [Candidatus Neomarinimicrobiota bacterium]
MTVINLEERLIKLEEVAHVPQNYRIRCKEMEKKVELLAQKVKVLENFIALNLQPKN